MNQFRRYLYAILIIIGFACMIFNKVQAGSGGSRGSVRAPFWVVTFYPLFGDVSPKPEQIDFTAMNEIIVFTTEITQSSPFLREMPGSADSGYFDGGYNKTGDWLKRIVSLAHTKGVKASMSCAGLPGSSDVNVTALMKDTNRINAFVNYVAAPGGFMQRRNLDGFNLDHEFAGGEGIPPMNIRHFWTRMREALNKWRPGAILSTCVPTWPEADVYGGVNASFFNGPTVDYIALMAYRFADGSNITGHNSPLFQPTATYPSYNGNSWFNNGYGHGPQAWADMGLNKNKIVVLIPFEGSFSTGSKLGQPRSGWMQFENYGDITKFIGTQYDKWDPIAKVPYIEDPTGFHSYENQLSLRYKVDTLRNGGYGGAGIWELFRGYTANASPPDQLLQFLKAAVGGIVIPPDTTTAKTASITATPLAIKLGQSVTVSGVSSEKATVYDLYSDGTYQSACAPAPWTRTISPTVPGTHIITAQVQWADGTWLKPIPSVTVTVADTAPPPVIISSLPFDFTGLAVGAAKIASLNANKVGATSATLTVTAYDIDGVAEMTLNLNGTPVVTPSSLVGNNLSKTAVISVPLASVLNGANLLTVTFGSNLAGSTSGFRLDAASIQTVVAPPTGVCDTIGLSAKYFNQGVASVKCPPAIDTAGVAAKYFNQGVASVKCPPSGGYTQAYVDSVAAVSLKNGWNSYFDALMGVFPAKR
jgi:GH18 family chitinase